MHSIEISRGHAPSLNEPFIGTDEAIVMPNATLY